MVVASTNIANDSRCHIMTLRKNVCVPLASFPLQVKGLCSLGLIQDQSNYVKGNRDQMPSIGAI